MIKKEDISKKEKIGEHRFSFNGNIVAEIGGESISNPNIAIAELIKNSYDADSEQVSLELVDIEKSNAKIIISDSGLGMDLSAIKDKFMDIGSPHKKKIERTVEHERIPVGAKGIGRFAAHSLGDCMTLITASKDENYGYELSFDWRRFSEKNKATDIDIPTMKFKKKISLRGTEILIEKLKQNWNDSQRLKDLLRDLRLLTSPINPPKKFRIKENISKKIGNLEKLNKVFLEKAVYRLNIKLAKKKTIKFEFYKSNQKIKSDKKELEKGLSCGDVSFDFYFYYRDASTWKKWTGRDIIKKDLKEIKSILDEYGGIKLYRDSFRVKPYGDKKADWIGLDKWAREQTMIPGNAQIFGVVSIGRESNSMIEDTTTREGVINNTEYYDLVQFITTSVGLFRELRSEVETTKAKARRSKKSKKRIKIEKPKIETPTIVEKGKPFIEISGNFPTNHYDQLIYELNECEDKDYPNAAFAISRKIIENLLFHILEKKYPKKIDLWYDTAHTRNQSFSKLISNLYSLKDDFKPNVKDYIEQFNSDVGVFRRGVNAAIHKNQVYLESKEELKKYKIKKLIQLLIDVYSNM